MEIREVRPPTSINNRHVSGSCEHSTHSHTHKKPQHKKTTEKHQICLLPTDASSGVSVSKATLSYDKSHATVPLVGAVLPEKRFAVLVRERERESAFVWLSECENGFGGVVRMRVDGCLECAEAFAEKLLPARQPICMDSSSPICWLNEITCKRTLVK